MRALLAVLLFALGCDAKATASETGLRPDQKSRELESCGASADCADGLRCFESVCRRTARSTVGDFYAASGAAARARGDIEGAIAAYASALAQYDAEKIALPPEIDCAYGGALAAAKSKKMHAELGARVLHRCVLAVPAGSRLRDQAIDELAGLAEVGLDPLLLGASKTADVYLTKAPQAPATDKLVVSVTAAPEPAKTFPLISERLAQDDLKKGLIACWEQYAAATKKTALTAGLGIKSSYIPSDYDDVPGRYVVKFEEAAARPGPEGAAEDCVRQLVEPAISELKIRESFQTRLTVAVK